MAEILCTLRSPSCIKLIWIILGPHLDWIMSHHVLTMTHESLLFCLTQKCVCSKKYFLWKDNIWQNLKHLSMMAHTQPIIKRSQGKKWKVVKLVIRVQLVSLHSNQWRQSERGQPQGKGEVIDSKTITALPVFCIWTIYIISAALNLICIVLQCAREGLVTTMQWWPPSSLDSIAVPLFTIRRKNPKNSDCEMSWLV